MVLIQTNWFANILFKNQATNRVMKHLFMRNDVALTRVCLVKYLLPTPLETQRFREATNVLSDFRFENKTNNFWKHFNEGFIYGGRIEGATLKSWNRFFLDIDFIKHSGNWKRI